MACNTSEGTRQVLAYVPLVATGESYRPTFLSLRTDDTGIPKLTEYYSIITSDPEQRRSKAGCNDDMLWLHVHEMGGKRTSLVGSLCSTDAHLGAASCDPLGRA